MPLLKNAKKALRQSQARAEVNQKVKSRVKNALDKAKAARSAEAVSVAFSALDRAKKHNLLHANKIARLKSQLSRLISA